MVLRKRDYPGCLNRDGSSWTRDDIADLYRWLQRVGALPSPDCPDEAGDLVRTAWQFVGSTQIAADLVIDKITTLLTESMPRRWVPVDGNNAGQFREYLRTAIRREAISRQRKMKRDAEKSDGYRLQRLSETGSHTSSVRRSRDWTISAAADAVKKMIKQLTPGTRRAIKRYCSALENRPDLDSTKDIVELIVSQVMASEPEKGSSKERRERETNKFTTSLSRACHAIRRCIIVSIDPQQLRTRLTSFEYSVIQLVEVEGLSVAKAAKRLHRKKADLDSILPIARHKILRMLLTREEEEVPNGARSKSTSH